MKKRKMESIVIEGLKELTEEERVLFYKEVEIERIKIRKEIDALINNA